MILICPAVRFKGAGVLFALFLMGLGTIQAQPVASEASPPPPLRHLSLAEALRLARAHSPRLRELEALQAIAAAEERQARAATRPDVEVGGSYSRLSNVPELAVPQPDGSFETIFPNIPDNFAARLSVSLPLYAGGRLRSAVLAAQHRRDAAAFDLATSHTDLVLEVTAAYWQWVVTAERRRVVDRAIATFDAHLVDAGNRRSFGLAARSDVLAVEVEKKRAELQLLEAERDHSLAAANLRRLLDLDEETTVIASDSLATPEVGLQGLEELVATAMAARPERQALLARIAAAETAVTLEQGSRRPQLRAAAGYDLAQPNRRILPPQDALDDSWDLRLSLSYNVFDGGKRSAAIARAGAQAEAARQRLSGLDRNLRLEVESHFLEVETARSAITVAQAALDSARENVRVTGERYRQGLLPSSELLDAETALLSSELDLTRAEVRLRLALAGLERSVGGAGPDPASGAPEG